MDIEKIKDVVCEITCIDKESLCSKSHKTVEIYARMIFSEYVYNNTGNKHIIKDALKRTPETINMYIDNSSGERDTNKIYRNLCARFNEKVNV